MKIPLNDFEQIIDETILERGLKYFKNGNVTNVYELSIGEYEAFVSGTEEYTVRLKIENNVIVEHYCNCPYDLGPVCKHIAAVIFYLKQDELFLAQENTHRNKKSGKNSIEQKLIKILNKLSHNELKEFIIEEVKTNKQFRDLFLLNFAYLVEDQSQKFFRQQIKSIINSSRDKYGFIHWHKINNLVKKLEPIISIAEKQFNNNDYTVTFSICTAMLEELTEALQFSDDSDGLLGGIIGFSIEMLYDIAEKDLDAEFRKTFFNYCITSFDKQIFNGWDWHFDLLKIAYYLSRNEKEADIVFNRLNTLTNEFEKESAQFLQLEIITKYKGKEEVRNFINKHITNHLIRKNEIEKAINNKDFNRAIKLSKEGIKYDEIKRPGLVKDWYNYLFEIAQLQNDKKRIIEYARKLYLDNYMPKYDYYEIMKENIPQNEWTKFVEELIKEIKLTNSWYYYSPIRKIYIKEKWWDKLLLMLKEEDITLEIIKENEQYLSKDYSEELIQLYSKEIIKYVEKFIGRNHYKTACKYLRRMKKLGGTEKVNELIEYFRKTYPTRRALLDELSKV